MLTANEVKGVIGMMPAFATPDAVDIQATQTIAVDNLKAVEVIDDIIGDGSGGKPVPGAGNKRPAEFADYCKVGPTRVPFLHFPEAELAKAKRRAELWMKLNAKYRPLVEALQARPAA